jgi:hypothetical protein
MLREMGIVQKLLMNINRKGNMGKTVWTIENIAILIALSVFGVLAIIAGWYPFFTGQPLTVLHVVGTIMGIIIFMCSYLKFYGHGKLKWWEYVLFSSPFIFLIIIVIYNYMGNMEELLSQETTSVLNYLTIVLLLGAILRQKLE